MEIYKCIYVWRGKRNRTQRRTKIPEAILTFSLPVSLVRSEKHKKEEAELTYKKKKEDGG